MPNTLLEVAIQGIGDGARLEQLAADILRREDYEVEPTGTRGPDNGRDSILHKDDETGILHCSVSENIERKIQNDAESAEGRDEDFDFFIFVSTENPAGVKRDRLEESISNDYSWRTKILDFERIRNRLLGERDNHDLAREHLSVDPDQAFRDVEAELSDKIETFRERLTERNAWYDSIQEQDPILAVHLIPAESLSGNTNRIDSDLADPPSLTSRNSGISQRFGDSIITAPNSGFGEEPYRHYTCFHVDGWIEAATTRIVSTLEEEALYSTIDELIVGFVEDALECYDEAGIQPPVYVYITVIDGEDFTIATPRRVFGPTNKRDLMEEVYSPNRSRIDSLSADVPSVLRRPLFQIWRRAGWSKSIHYEENEDGEYIWEPYDS